LPRALVCFVSDDIENAIIVFAVVNEGLNEVIFKIGEGLFVRNIEY
jgi:hypothetical protein